jgi:8-oxo-dGTP diphosphatase
VTFPRVGVGVLVKRGEDLLLVRRQGSHGAGTWSPPGGYLDFGEHPADCAARETREETGLEVDNPRFAGLTNDLFPEDEKHFVTLWFEADYAGGEAAVAAEDELSEVRWFPRAGLPHPLFAPFERFVAGELLRP